VRSSYGVNAERISKFIKNDRLLLLHTMVIILTTNNARQQTSQPSLMYFEHTQFMYTDY